MLQIIPHDGIGGVEEAARLAATRQGGSVEVVFLGRPSADPIAPAPHVTHAGGGLRSAFVALAHARRTRPEVIVFSLWRTWLAFALIRLFGPRARVVTFLHCDRPVHAVDALVTGLQVRLSDEAWADSAETLRLRLGERPSKPARAVSFVLYRLDGRPRLSPRPDFVFWGRIKPQKAVPDAVRLLGALARNHPDLTYQVIGPDGGQKDEALSAAEETGLGARLSFAGPRPFTEIPQLASTASFFIQLSLHEGMAMAVVEAMQMGLVPVVTPVGEVARYCRHMENAIIFSSPEQALADIETVLADPALFARMSTAAIDHWAQARLYDEDFMAAADAAARREN